MTVSVASFKTAFAFREWVEVEIREVVNSQFAVTFSRAPLVGQKQIFRDGVRLIPGVGLVGPRAPGYPLFNGFARQVRNSRVGGVLQNAIGVRIFYVLVGL